MSFFPEDFITFVDESHVTASRSPRDVRGRSQSQRDARFEHGFRLPSAMDNRPLKFEEWEGRTGQICFVSATPGDYELGRTDGEVVEQIIRPTGLLDPIIEVVSARGQVNHLLEEIRKRARSTNACW